MRTGPSVAVVGSLLVLGIVCIIQSNLFIVTHFEGENVWMGPWERNFTLYVNSTMHSVNVTIITHRFVIPYFNTNGNTVSIVVASEHSVILNLSQVSGEQIAGLTYSVYSVEDPPQDIGAVFHTPQYNITLYWEGTDTEVSFTCQQYLLMHADTLVRVTEPGYYPVSYLGYSLVGIGILLGVSIMYLSFKRYGHDE